MANIISQIKLPDNKVYDIKDNQPAVKDMPDTPCDIATFTDGASLPMPTLKVGIEPIQDLHGYDHPWSGGAGKNKLDYDNSIKATSRIEFNYGTTLKANTPYTFSYYGNDNVTILCYQHGTDTRIFSSGYVKTYTYTPTEDMLVDISFYRSPSLIIEENLFQLEIGSTATAFAPYSNICPISGHTEANVSVCGVNVWDEEWELGYIDSQGNNTPNAGNIRSKNFTQIEPNTRYYLKSGYTTVVYCPIFFYDANKVFLSANLQQVWNTVITTPSNARYIRFYMNSAYGNVYNNDISINYPSTDTEYHAYNGQTYKVEFKDGSNPLTVYGGTLDVVSGELTVDRASVDMGDLPQPWGYVSNGNRFTNGSLASLIKLPLTDGIVVEAITSQLKVLSLNDLKVSSNDALFAVGDTGTISVRYTSCGTDTETIKTTLTGVQLVYELATPLTIQLTPTQVKSLLGVNNIWADTGDVLDAEYIRDATTIINSLIARIEALENA